MATWIIPRGNGSRSTAGNGLASTRLRKRSALPSILLTNIQSLENKMNDLRARISFQWDIRDCNILCLTETWLTTSVPGTAVTPSDNFTVLRMDRIVEAGKTKGGGVSFMINKNVTPGISPFCHAPARLICNIYPLSAVHSICFGSFNRSLFLLFTFHHRQTLAWLCLSFTMCSVAILKNTLTLPLSSWGTLTKISSGRLCRTYINMYPFQLQDQIHWIIATISLKMPTMPAHYRPLTNRTMPPFSSHRNKKTMICSGTPGGESCDALVLPLRRYATGGSWWRWLGHVPGRLHLMSVSSRM